MVRPRRLLSRLGPLKFGQNWVTSFCRLRRKAHGDASHTTITHLVPICLETKRRPTSQDPGIVPHLPREFASWIRQVIYQKQGGTFRQAMLLPALPTIKTHRGIVGIRTKHDSEVRTSSFLGPAPTYSNEVGAYSIKKASKLLKLLHPRRAGGASLKKRSR